jgi:hypothetical protein
MKKQKIAVYKEEMLELLVLISNMEYAQGREVVENSRKRALEIAQKLVDLTSND